MKQDAVPDSLVDSEQEQNHAKIRRRRININTATSFFAKIVSFLANIIIVPVAVNYFGAERYGLWVTINNISAILLLADLGIYNTLTTLMSYAYAQNDRELSSKYTMNSLIMTTTIALLIALVFAASWKYLSWDRLFSNANPNLTEEIKFSAACAIAIFAINLPTNIAAKILTSHQEIGLANTFVAAGSVLSIILILLAAQFYRTLPALVISSSIAVPFANSLCLLWIVFRHKPWLKPSRRYIDRTACTQLLKSSGYFFVIQIAAMLVFNSDNLVIAHLLGPEQVTPYNVTYRLVNFIAIPQTLMLPTLWPAYAEAYARRDSAWIRRTFLRTSALTMFTTIVGSAIIIIFGKTIILHWAGADAVPDENLLIAICGWLLISTIASNQSCLLAATNTVRLQAWASAATAVVNLSIAVTIVGSVGAVGVTLGTIVSYLLILLPLQSWQIYKMLSGRN
jgi:O-antigen/teichoic acid export membrane protein